MAISYYKGHDSYVIYGEETSYGAGATPASGNQFGKVQNFTLNMSNNMFKVRGLGEGRNIQNSVTGPFDVNGSVEAFVNDFTVFQYLVGERQGAGTVADPYELAERENVGYSAGEIPSLELEVGSEGGSNDDVTTVTGVVLTSATITANQGELVSSTFDWVGRTVSNSTTLISFSPSTNKPFVFHEGSVQFDSDTLDVMSASVTIENALKTDHRELGDRFIKQPTTDVRNYTFSITVRKKFDDNAGVLSSTELRDVFYGNTNSPATSGTITAKQFQLQFSEGAGTGDRVVQIDLENAFVDSWSEPIPLEGGVIEVTIEGYGHAGLTDGSDKVPIRFWTI